MIHMKKWFGVLVVSSALLGACQAEESKEKKETPEVAEEAAVEQKIAIPSKEALVQLVDQHFSGIMDGLSAAAYDFNLEGGDVTDAIYEAMKARFNNFATQSYIDGDLKVIAKDYCYSGCDAFFFPHNFEGALAVEVEEVRADELKLTAKHPADIMSSDVAFMDTVYLKYDDALWKVDRVDYEKITLALTQEQAKHIATDWGYTNPQFVEERDGSFIFKADGMTLSINKETGFVEEGTSTAAASAPVASTTGSLFDTYNAKLDAASVEAQRISDSFTGYTTVEMNENAAQIFEVWDTLLNDMYGALKKNLSVDEFAQLQQDQREWITERDDYAEYTAAEVEGGTLYNSIYVQAQADYTAQRCSDFLYDYMVGL